MKAFTLITVLFLSFAARAQRVDSICFHLYTDSLKTGVYNYINVDGKLSNGNFLPLMSDEVQFTSSAGRWDGNSLIIDSAVKVDSINVTACLKKKPQIKSTVTIYMKKILTPASFKNRKGAAGRVAEEERVGFFWGQAIAYCGSLVATLRFKFNALLSFFYVLLHSDLLICAINFFDLQY